MTAAAPLVTTADRPSLAIGIVLAAMLTFVIMDGL